MPKLASARGFTLFETVVAAGILITAVAGVAQLFVLGSHLTHRAVTSNIALIAAQEKLESLRALTFAFDDLGNPVTDSALTLSPPGTLDEDSEPYVDRPGDRMIRRWRITSAGAASPDAIAIEVCVFAGGADDPPLRAADACISTIRTRQP